MAYPVRYGVRFSCSLALSSMFRDVLTKNNANAGFHWSFCAIFSGIILEFPRGVGAGYILCNDVPLLFRSELYASVSVVTGLFYATAFGLQINAELWTILTFVLGISFRLLAVRYKWEMPKFVFTGDEQ